MSGKKRTRFIEFKVRTKRDEADTIRRRITHSNLKTFQAYALEMLLHGKIETYDYSELQQLRIEVNRIGNNINQLVKYVNTFQDFDQELLLSLQKEVKEMNRLITKEFKTKGHATLNGSDEGNAN